MQLTVNFKSSIIDLCKEERNLDRIKDVKLLYSIKFFTQSARPLYPFAVAL